MQPAPIQQLTEYYRCSVQGQIQIELSNVRMQPRSLLVVGAPGEIGAAGIGIAMASLIGRVRRQRLEGQTRFVPASGDVALMNDRIRLRLAMTGGVRGVTLTNDPVDRTIDIQIPYALIKRWGNESAGVYLDVAGEGVIWLRPNDHGEFGQWLAHLSHGQTWIPPLHLAFLPEVETAGWCQQDQRFTFALPAGWTGPSDMRAFAEFSRQVHPLAIRAVVGDGNTEIEIQFIVFELVGGEPAPTDFDPEEMAAGFVAALGISPVGPLHIIDLGGTPATFVRSTAWTPEGPQERTWVSVIHNGIAFIMWYQVVGAQFGDGNHDRFMPELRTILATWRW
jgi:hypothetical protein